MRVIVERSWAIFRKLFSKSSSQIWNISKTLRVYSFEMHCRVPIFWPRQYAGTRLIRAEISNMLEYPFRAFPYAWRPKSQQNTHKRMVSRVHAPVMNTALLCVWPQSYSARWLPSPRYKPRRRSTFAVFVILPVQRKMKKKNSLKAVPCLLDRGSNFLATAEVNQKTHTHAHARTHTCTRTHTYAHTCTHTYPHADAHKHTQQQHQQQRKQSSRGHSPHTNRRGKDDQYSTVLCTTDMGVLSAGQWGGAAVRTSTGRVLSAGQWGGLQTGSFSIFSRSCTCIVSSLTL